MLPGHLETMASSICNKNLQIYNGKKAKSTAVIHCLLYLTSNTFRDVLIKSSDAYDDQTCRKFTTGLLFM